MQILAVVLALFSFQSLSAFPCNWAKPYRVGLLEKRIDEASGLAVSRRIPDRLYHINDSDKRGGFFITDKTGHNTREVYITGFQPKDTEDLALGPCDSTTDCLFIGDIGDNDRVRKEIEIIVVEERTNFPGEVPIRNRVRIRYPDGSHDAESMAVHPDGDIYILTKNLRLNGLRPTVGPAAVYRLKQSQWRNSKNTVEMMEAVAALDFAKLLPGSLLGGQLPTGMSISADGKRFLVLTYQDAVEFLIDLSTPASPLTWKEGQHYRRIPLQILPQQEAISFSPDGKAFLYSTERMSGDAPIVEVKCAQ
jgi:hypothetical protein